LAYGDAMTVGMRDPGPHRSARGGVIGSQNPPFSS
jgi:hypothetical protein